MTTTVPRRRAAAPTPLRVVAEVRRSLTPFWCILGAAALLCLVGATFVLSASSVKAARTLDSPWHYFLRQLLWLGMGLVAGWIAYRIGHRRWLRWSPVLLVGAVVALGLVLTPLGTEVNGAKRWLGSSAAEFQPSELAKLAVVLWLARLIGRRRHAVRVPRAVLLPALVVTGVVAGLVVAEPDLGTTILIVSVVFAMLAVAGCRLDLLAAVAVPAAGLGLAASMWGFRRGRMLAFLDPWEHADRWGFQTLQSQVSLASGGLFGVGLGQSRAKWGFLPEAHTDFIFAIIGEELGLVGCVAVVGLFGVFVLAGVTAARRAPDLEGAMVAVGISAWIGLQALINIGVSVGALPNKGITLPFVSYGGSSLVVAMIATGILLSVARRPSDVALRTPTPGR